MPDRKEENEIFINKFDFKKYGFFDVTPFIDCHIGFIAKRKLDGRQDDYVTLLSIYIPDRIFNDTKITKKPLFIYASYGRKVENGVKMRENSKYTDPTDCEFPNKYFYDIKTKNLYKDNTIISADELINKVYNKHIKSTKLIRGFWIRTKIKFCRILMKSIFEFMSKIFQWLLYIISGDSYSYNPLSKEGKLNNRIVKDNKPDEYKTNPEPKPEIKKGEKVSFLGYKASPHCILFYSFFHFCIYFIFLCGINYYPLFITDIFQNGFLILVYVMLSLIIIDKVMPKILMILIDTSLILSFNFLYKSIRL